MNFNSKEALESFIDLCEELLIPAEEGLFGLGKSKCKEIVKSVCAKVSVKNKKMSILRTNVDNETVNKFIGTLNSEFDTVCMSSIIHVTGDYNYYTQYFVALKNNTLCIFSVIHSDTTVKFGISNSYREIDLSKINFDKNFIMMVYREAFRICGSINPFMEIKIKSDKISINSYNRKLTDLQSKLQNSNYNISLEKGGFKLIITNSLEL